MATSFLFVEHSDETGGLCLRLEREGEVGAPLAHRTYADLLSMQEGSRLVVVVSAVHCGLHEVELPWLSDRKARLAIPFALEEHLVQPLPSLHFAFDSAHHQQNRYLVAVIDKAYLVDLISRLDDAGIAFDEITVDWFALRSGENAITPTTVLANVEAFKGALSGDLATRYLETLSEADPVLSFTDSLTNWIQPTYASIDDSFFVWAAKRLQCAARLNLCQGELARAQHQDGFNRHWALVCAALAGGWFCLVLLVNAINVIRLNHQLAGVDADIAVLYRQFFPEATQVISPKFRISQLLKAGHTSQDAALLWRLLDAFEKAMVAGEVTVEQLEYKNKQLAVTLKGRDFGALDGLAERLKKAHVKVSQTQAVSHESHVTATLELRV